MTRRFEWVLALVFAAAVATAVLWRPGPRPEDVELTVVSVREQQPEPGQSQRIEVKVRWHWLRNAAQARSSDMLVLGVDRDYWVPAVPNQSYGPDEDLLPRLGVSGARSAYPVTAGEDGELTIVLGAWRQGYWYQTRTLPLQIHWLHQSHPEFGPPGRSWVQSTGGLFPVRAD